MRSFLPLVLGSLVLSGCGLYDLSLGEWDWSGHGAYYKAEGAVAPATRLAVLELAGDEDALDGLEGEAPEILVVLPSGEAASLDARAVVDRLAENGVRYDAVESASGAPLVLVRRDAGLRAEVDPARSLPPHRLCLDLASPDAAFRLIVLAGPFAAEDVHALLAASAGSRVVLVADPLDSLAEAALAAAGFEAIDRPGLPGVAAAQGIFERN